MPIEKIDTNICNGCEICVDSCPMDVLRFDNEINHAYIKYPEDCIACYNCELDCPENAIYITPFRGMTVPPAW